VSWVLVFLGFIVLIVLHEFGHFIAAKATGMRVERFFLFFPPKLVSVKRGETEYGIGAIPLGGFVKITGMNPEELERAEEGADSVAQRDLYIDPDAGRDTPEGLLERIESSGQDSDGLEGAPPEVLKRAYYNQPVWKRVVVIGAGPAVNIVLAMAILFVLALTMQKPTTLEVGNLQTGKPAAAVLKPGDRLVSINGVTPTAGGSNPSPDQLDSRQNQFINALKIHHCAGSPTDGCLSTTPATIVVIRNGKRLTLHATPFYDAKATDAQGKPDPRFRLGFGFQGGSYVPENLSVPAAAGRAASAVWQVTSGTVSRLARLFEPQERAQLHGVVGISDVAHQTINSSARDALALLALVSLSLGIINLFPFLPLDGGHIFWSLIEKVRGQRVPFYVIERASVIGFMLVIGLFLIGLTNDISQLSNGGIKVR
jgi:regulator of sigma E protease